MGNELSSKKSSSSRATSKSMGGGSFNPVDAIFSLCSPATDDSQQLASADHTPANTSGKQKTGRSSYQPTAPRSRQTRTTGNADKSDRSIKTSIKNVQKDVSMKSADQRKKVVPTDDSCHTFAASLATQSGHYRKGNDYVMITDAMSDVRVNYHIDSKEVGHGHYGVVRKCMHRETGEWYAIKSIRKAKVSKIEVLKREIDILKEVRHPNIIHLVRI